MALKSTNTRWGWATRALHWSIALAVFGMFTAGFYAGTLDPSTPADRGQYNAVINVHKSFGLLILMMMVVRVLWRLSERTPKLPSTVPAWERIAARAAHLLLYVGLFVMPISGYLMAIGEPEPVQFFGDAAAHARAARLLDACGRLDAPHCRLRTAWDRGIARFWRTENHVIDRNGVLCNMAGLTRDSTIEPNLLLRRMRLLRRLRSRRDQDHVPAICTYLRRVCASFAGRG